MAPDLLAPLSTAGGKGGAEYKVQAWERGQRVRKIEVFAGGWLIKAIRLWLTDDAHFQEFGRHDDRHKSQEFTFKDDESIKSMSLWCDGDRSRAGAIKFVTSAGRTFDYGMFDSKRRKKEVKVDVGSGILVGAVLRAGEDIDAMSFYFLSSEVLRGHLGSVRYGGHLQGNSEVEALDFYTQVNKFSTPICWTFTGEKEVPMIRKWTSSKETFFKADTLMNTEVPCFDVKSTFQWQTGRASCDERSKEERKKLFWSNSGQLSPGQSISLEAITRKGTLEVPYTGIVTISLANGAKFEFEETGTFTGVEYGSVEIRSTWGMHPFFILFSLVYSFVSKIMEFMKGGHS
ncbi:hypothetical protein KP509_02G024600 [Ceratopteris richardii]|uniref:Jacalin-type lectin domain-containing protein n=1 Tax=Ceratopteris richardii TaxID=49495 RepID=A0A8T2V7Y3_CERRI|nr:hypothetical protein KP509_02G024600 [Ceratopteris richardii]